MKRWLATVNYRAFPTSCFIEHEIEEIEELQGLIERGPDWNCIDSIAIKLARGDAMSAYPKPSTPLPWRLPLIKIVDAEGVRLAQDKAYEIHAANAFPHLVAALEKCEHETHYCQNLIGRALRIARGEVKP